MSSIIKKINTLLDVKQQRKLFVLSFMMLIGGVLEALGVSLVLPLITTIMNPDIIETNVKISQLCSLLNIHKHQTFVIVCIAALIAVFIIKDLFLIFQYYIQAKFVYNCRFSIQRRLLHTYMLRPYEYFLNVESGEIVRVIDRDVTETFLLLTAVLSLATESVIFFALIITVFVLNPAMTLLLAVSMGMTVFVILKIIRPILQKAGLSLQKNRASSYKWLLQSINGIKEVKISHTEAFFEENYNQSGARVVQAERQNSVLNNIPRLLIEMVTVCSMLLFIAIMVLLGRDIQHLISIIGAFAMAAMKLLPSTNRIVAAFNSIAYMGPALDPNSDTQVLRHADMVIPVGKSVGIVGTSGAGKTTAVDVLLGLLKPQEGQILADGVDVMENYTQWLTKIGYIPQSIFMLDDSIRANVTFGLHTDEQSDAQVWKALEEAQLADFVRSLPQGLDTTIGERGVRLSGGQRQRIGIARALYSDPELLVFDEATSALDNETEAAIMESIHSLHGKKTLIIIAHRLQTIKGCDIVYRVHEGAIERER